MIKKRKNYDVNNWTDDEYAFWIYTYIYIMF